MNFNAYLAAVTWRKRVAKLLFIMKLSIIVVICSILQVSASSYGQQITLKQHGISLKSVFKEIKRQTGFDVIYADKVLNDKRMVDVFFQSATLRMALDETLKGLAVDFIIEDKSIILSRKIESGILNHKTLLADFEIKGRITDENNQPIPGVTIRTATSASNSARSSSAQLLYTSTAISNTDGSFTIKADDSSIYLVFSYIGYDNKIIKIDGQKNFKVTMLQSKNPLDEVQVIAYGTTTKRLSTGSVASLKQEQIEKQPVSNPLQAMEGRLSGVYITEPSGVPGSNISLKIRGTNSILSGNSPLYIIDGVPFNAQSTELTSGALYSPTNIVGGSFSPFDNIPTSDIESIEVLKDADATAIYGSRAANGVVLITTRKGKSGAMKVSMNLYSGISDVTRSIKMMNTEQYLAVRRQAFSNDNITPTAANAPDLFAFGDGNTDFVEELMGNTAHFTDATFSVSGGNKLSQYLISGNYRHQGTVLAGDFGDNKGTIRFSTQTQSQNSKFSVNFSGAFTKNVNNLPTNNVQLYYSLPPNLPLYNADGTFFWNNSYTNPVAGTLAPREVKTDNITLNGTLKYDIIPGLSFKTDLGFNRISFNMVSANTRASRNPNTTVNGSVLMQNNFSEIYTIEPQLNFTRKIGPGRLTALAGATYQYSLSNQPFYLQGTFTNDALYTDLGSLTIVTQSSGFNDSKFASLFGRLNYTIDDKYIFSFNGRRDGSSRFGTGRKYGDFGSVGGAWLFGEEDLIKNNLPWLSFGKLRASYGTLGNDQLQDYSYMALYQSSPFATSYAGVPTLVPRSIANPDLSWEVTKKFDIATDLNFLKDKIVFTAGWYRNISNNMLVPSPTATQTGFSYFLANLPATVENKGWEFTLDTKNIHGNNFNWSTSINLTIPKNRLLKYDNIKSSYYASQYIVGQPLSVVQAYHFTGFDNDGVAQFQDIDGNGIISAGANTVTGVGDYINVGNTDPKFYGGLSNTFSYKGFQLDFLFQFVKKDGYNIYNIATVPGVATNLPVDVLNQPFKYTTQTGSVAGLGFTRYKTSDATFGDASFIRLKTVSLSYNFNNSMIRKIGLQNLNVYMRAQNLLTFTKYLGNDPETLGNYIPTTRMISLGFQTTF
jgi:TonB-linked SusC/RagA family outer membrane protein